MFTCAFNVEFLVTLERHKERIGGRRRRGKANFSLSKNINNFNYLDDYFREKTRRVIGVRRQSGHGGAGEWVGDVNSVAATSKFMIKRLLQWPRALGDGFTQAEGPSGESNKRIQRAGSIQSNDFIEEVEANSTDRRQ